MVDVIYARIDDECPTAMLEYVFNRFPTGMKEKNRRFIHWRDRQANFIGHVLLLYQLERLGYGTDCLNDIVYDPHGKPFISCDISFNVSHSGNFVVCAASKGCTVGVDIEEIRPISFDDFHNTMSVEQWRDVFGAADPLRMFFSYWVTKESAAKGDGRGILLPFDRIKIDGNLVDIDRGSVWYTYPLNISEDYCAVLACDCDLEIDKVKLRCVRLVDFLSNLFAVSRN